MLSEMLMTRVPNLKVLQVNTDGITVRIPKEHSHLYWEICKEWENITKLELEYVSYSKMIINNVNNYIAVKSKDGGVKYKGLFKPNSEMIKDGEYQKSFSQGIVAIAVSDYFLKGIPVEQTVMNHSDIYDFCKTFNTSHGWVSETVDIVEGKEYNKQEAQKTNRYYVSTNGKTFRKIKDDRTIEIESNKLVTIMNTYTELPIEDRNIDYDYYINECYKIIHKIDGTLERQADAAKMAKLLEKQQKEEDNYIKFCINKIPTEKQFDTYKRDWLIEKYGIPQQIKPSKK